MSNPAGVEVTGPMRERFDEVLTPEALSFLAELHRTFDARRRELLDRRAARQAELAAGGTLDFLEETKNVREGDWRVADPAPGLEDRRVEITGPTDAKMTINALNSGAKVWLADHEDANTPLWENVIQGQLNLRDAIDRTLSFTSPEGKSYTLNEGELATIVVRPRGWHLTEKHILVDGERMSGSLVDFGLYFFHCAKRQLERGSGPYFYLPKMESHLEARLWNDVFVLAQDRLGVPRGTIRATVLVETYPAAFEMEEILYELREHSAGLNAGRWDYIFSAIKKFRTRGKDFLLPDRNSVTMTAPFMRAYTELLVRTCHKRGAHAIGGMAAFIPSRRDAEVNAAALEKVRADKTREAGDGFDGSWVAHPDLVPVCREVFDGVLGDRPNQRDKTRDEVSVTAAQLLDVKDTPGEMTEVGLRNAVSVGIQYLAAWLRGSGAVAIFNMMEDAATAEISRSQVWQWLHNDVTLADSGEKVTRELVDRIADEEIAKLGGDPAAYAEARSLFMEVAVADDFAEFLTLPAYERMP
ncbi:malate synthase A [Planosporangium mesophilum]|uniref:Malate synthase n=1 Tax=Planosporangium mesophilum TaxID=689768 RepID=A0A8J3TGX3_9ACTN|nr:malate synthase A [Planosporangium mesophilum]NJC86594.1 malate synthase A [Planosporangium mesophilum]GII25381.1 malate synthase [Planosporangium mesophilum]